MSDGALKEQVNDAIDATAVWLDTVECPEIAAGVSRFSVLHDAEQWPGMLLPGTYNATLLRKLLALPFADANSTIHWLHSHRQPNGVFRLDGMQAQDTWKCDDMVETTNYIDFHVSNYTLGALRELDSGYTPVLDFALDWLNRDRLENWLDKRNWDDPWMEGNNIVNVASFLVLAKQHKLTTDDELLSLLCQWLERMQSSATGFWGNRQELGGAPLLHAFAGAMHAYHLWYFLERPLPFHSVSADYVLSLPTEPMGACLDVDAVDLLFHAALLTDHRRSDITAWLRSKLAVLLSLQLPDGGFPDLDSGQLRFDGWVNGYSEAQGQSSTFASWFRWIAIGMICEHLWPGWRQWGFRQTLGIGYARKTARG